MNRDDFDRIQRRVLALARRQERQPVADPVAKQRLADELLMLSEIELCWAKLELNARKTRQNLSARMKEIDGNVNAVLTMMKARKP